VTSRRSARFLLSIGCAWKRKFMSKSAQGMPERKAGRSFFTNEECCNGKSQFSRMRRLELMTVFYAGAARFFLRLAPIILAPVAEHEGVQATIP